VYCYALPANCACLKSFNKMATSKSCRLSKYPNNVPTLLKQHLNNHSKTTTTMKKLLIAALFVPCMAQAQVETKLTYTIPQGFSSAISFYTAENDEAVAQANATPGTHEVTIRSNSATTGFLYVSSLKKFLPVTLSGGSNDITKSLGLPDVIDEDAVGAAGPEVFPAILQKMLAMTNSMRTLGYVPQQIKDSAAAAEKARAYYRYLQGMIGFADSIVTLYPKDNASLFTVFRLAHWCSLSPEVFTVLRKLDASLLKNDFAKELASSKQKMESDSIASVGKKPGVGLLMVANNPKLNSASATKRIFIYWDEQTHLERDLIDDLTRMYLLYGSRQVQVNFVYTGTAKNWEAVIKQASLPAFANYLHCNKADALGTNPVVINKNSVCLFSGIKGYYLYKKLGTVD
jgi:hypothetical protein